MTTYRRCRHGYFREGWCFACEREDRVMGWLERRDRHITVAIGIPTLLGLLWVAGQVAVHVI